MTRRRGQVLESAIIEGALAELADSGYQGFRMESVARRAGTGKAVLYRRWPDRDALILDAVRGGVPAPPSGLQYSGDVRADLLATYRGMAHGLASPIGRAMLAVLAETHRRPDLLAAMHAVIFDPAEDQLRELLRDAAQAGEVDPAVVESQVISLGHEHLVFVALTTGRVGEDDVSRVLDKVMTPVLGLRPRSDGPVA